MYRVLTTALLSVVALGHAFAADLPPAAPPRAPAIYVPAVVPVYNWGGFYIGLNGGWGFASGTTTSTVTGTGTGLDGTTGTGSGSLNGGLAGGQIGANYQIDALVIGIEGDFDWSGQKRTDSFACGAACTVSETIKLPWIATIRGRFGYAIDRVLLYATGGVAFTNSSDNVTATGPRNDFQCVIDKCWLDDWRRRRSRAGAKLDREDRISLRRDQREAERRACDSWAEQFPRLQRSTTA